MEAADVENGVLRICGEPIDVHLNGTGMCMKHYLGLMQPVIKQATEAIKVIRAKAQEAENEESINTPSFGVGTPSYLK